MVDWKNPNHLRTLYLTWMVLLACFFASVFLMRSYSSPVTVILFLALMFSLLITVLLTWIFGTQLVHAHKKSSLWVAGIFLFGAITVPVLLYTIYSEKKK